MLQDDLDRWHMARALELAAQGRGAVEPNPLVGCIIAHGAEIVGEGWHRRYGGPHAEIEALRIAGPRARGATLYVTLEPCCHHGKTPPCTAALVAAGVRRVVAAQRDPFPRVDGQGARQLEAAGIAVEFGIGAAEAAQLNAPYLKLLQDQRPWVIAKWAMTLDGKLASRGGDSQWISNAASREIVHALRGRVDAILVGSGTVRADNPLLTARPPGPRTALRVVLDSRGALDPGSQLVRTARDTPVLVAVADSVLPERRRSLEALGCEVYACAGGSEAARLDSLLAELGRRQLTNVLVEGGSRVLGTFFDARAVDEAHVFVAPKLLGGASATTPVGGQGLARMNEAWRVEQPAIRVLEGDVYVAGRVGYAPAAAAS
ncbi:MAG: bifunctional diaminohydroxyphosphoribosylaminopyrimidine deaminase/5-amino-6-(5-phosphoribosylamino)uracil reductase RibD [Planctomycetaceae bacterium]|nr:bifunctional diaminohydroxyphosphoribosylaminopyrimidine deaminase/5-amino-6-(5-phosphoribosylamino)uracil reductase RibD [Planctomycetaceae bacterium]